MLSLFFSLLLNLFVVGRQVMPNDYSILCIKEEIKRSWKYQDYKGR